MSRRFRAFFLLVAFPAIVMADEAPSAAGTAPAATPADSGENAVAVPQDRLPTAPEPGFLYRHPLSMPKVSLPKIAWGKLKPDAGYGGFGVFNDMLHLHGDLQTQAGHFYVRAGRFMDTNAFSSVNAGWRYPIDGEMDKDGFFAGVFGGQIIADSFLGKTYNRLGAGADMSYQWMTGHTMKVASVGLGFGEPKKRGDASKQAKPVVFFSYTIDLKAF